MDTNESLANTHSVIGNSIYMKSGSNSGKYVSATKSLQTVDFGGFAVRKMTH